MTTSPIGSSTAAVSSSTTPRLDRERGLGPDAEFQHLPDAADDAAAASRSAVAARYEPVHPATRFVQRGRAADQHQQESSAAHLAAKREREHLRPARGRPEHRIQFGDGADDQRLRQLCLLAAERRHRDRDQCRRRQRQHTSMPSKARPLHRQLCLQLEQPDQCRRAAAGRQLLRSSGQRGLAPNNTSITPTISSVGTVSAVGVTNGVASFTGQRHDDPAERARHGRSEPQNHAVQLISAVDRRSTVMSIFGALYSAVSGPFREQQRAGHHFRQHFERQYRRL